MDINPSVPTSSAETHYSVAKLPYNHVRDIFYIVVTYPWEVLFSGFEFGVKRTDWKKENRR